MIGDATPRVYGAVSRLTAARLRGALLLTSLLGCSGQPDSVPTLGTGGSSSTTGGALATSGGSAGAGAGGAAAAGRGGVSGGGVSASGGAGAATPSGGAGTSRGGAAGSAGAPSAGTPGTAGASGSPLCGIELQCNGETEDDPKIPCTLRIVDGAGTIWYAGSAGVELRGRSSLNYPKKNYGVELRLPTGEENPVPMLGMGKEADWIFDGSWVDRSFMRGDLVYALFRDMGRYAPESRYCTLRLNQQNQGIYRLSEKIKRDDDRVAITADDGSASSFILGQDDEGQLNFPAGSMPESARWQFVYPKQELATAAQMTAAQTFLNQLNAALKAPDPGNSSGGPFAYLDFEAAVDFVLLQEFAKNIDAYNLSLNLFRSSGGKAAFIPWDFDLSFGQPTVRNATNESPEGWVSNRTPLITGLANMQALRARLATRWRELRAQSFSNTAILGRLDQFQLVLQASAVTENFTIWPINQVDFSRIYRPYTLYPVSSYAQEVSAIRTFIQARLAWMDAHIDAYPN